MKITYELDTEEDDKDDIEALHNAIAYRSLLWEIDQFCRTTVKHGKRPIEEETLIEIRRMIGEVGI